MKARYLSIAGIVLWEKCACESREAFVSCMRGIGAQSQRLKMTTRLDTLYPSFQLPLVSSASRAPKSSFRLGLVNIIVFGYGLVRYGTVWLSTGYQKQMITGDVFVTLRTSNALQHCSLVFVPLLGLHAKLICIFIYGLFNDFSVGWDNTGQRNLSHPYRFDDRQRIQIIKSLT